MKSLTLILAFLPLIAFSLLSRFLPHGYIGIAGVAAALIALAAILTSRPVWPPKILNTCSLALFALIAALGFTLGTADDRWLATWACPGSRPPPPYRTLDGTRTDAVTASAAPRADRTRCLRRKARPRRSRRSLSAAAASPARTSAARCSAAVRPCSYLYIWFDGV
jgi:hypothetical protein